ncbi:hypothetical protein BKA64DRAFT_634630 [Cadophora sp. MPI-SDFR-AT-0126]|nr:hypothetical protein BKA64DRAFT_634630 [Leotiomycetes sp. MPI-SDFR-AT-0126]
MAKFITDFCINFQDHSTCSVDEAQLFDKFKKKIDMNILNVQSTLVTDKDKAENGNDGDVEKKAKQQGKQNFESIEEVSKRLKDIKDIRDGLNMLKAVLTQQKSVQNELYGITTETGDLTDPAYAINNILEMDSHAVLSVLGLEQNEASMQEAMSSREQAQESIRQGRTLIVFTIVTIFFETALHGQTELSGSSNKKIDDSLLFSWSHTTVVGSDYCARFLSRPPQAILRSPSQLWHKTAQRRGIQTEPQPAAVNGITGNVKTLGNSHTETIYSSSGQIRYASSDSVNRISYTSHSSFKTRRGKGKNNTSPILPK